MITVKNKNEVNKMRISNRVVGELLLNLEDLVKPGISTFELNEYAEEFIRKNGAQAAFKGYVMNGLNPFPAAICASVNSCIVHGIPSRKVILREGDIIGVDVGILKDGFYGDAARTYRVGGISPEGDELIKVTEKSFFRGISKAVAGARIGDISYAIGSFVKDNGYFVADNLTGHGIGRNLHEDPIIPNSGIEGRGPRLMPGMTLAIEPMVNIGTNRVKEIGWEFYVADDTLSAHYENTILITDGEPEILSIA